MGGWQKRTDGWLALGIWSWLWFVCTDAMLAAEDNGPCGEEAFGVWRLERWCLWRVASFVPKDLIISWLAHFRATWYLQSRFRDIQAPHAGRFSSHFRCLSRDVRQPSSLLAIIAASRKDEVYQNATLSQSTCCLTLPKYAGESNDVQKIAYCL